MIENVRKDTRSSLLLGSMRAELFGCEIDVVLRGGENLLPYAARCAAYFNALPEELSGDLKRCTLRYYNDMKRFNAENEGFPADVKEENLLEHITPRCLIVEPPKRKDVIAFGVQLDCDWEPAHGLEWTVNDGRILYVGDYVGVSAWYPARVYETDCVSYVDEHFSMG